MKKYLHIPIAILLIAVGIWGCTVKRPRPLLNCFPATGWTAVSGSHYLPGSGSNADLDITPGQLKEAMEEITVRPRSDFSGWTCQSFLLHIDLDAEVLSVEIGENGNITIARLADPEGTRTCWHAPDADLYGSLLGYIKK